MTQNEINRCVVLALEARAKIKELRDAGLIKDSYSTIINAGLNGIDKRLKRIKPEAN
jgi:predicted chitinase